MGALITGILSSLFALFYVKLNLNLPDDKFIVVTVLVCLTSLLISMWLFLVLTEVISSGVASTFVCLAEDPATLQRQQPALFAKIQQTWPDITWGSQSTAYAY